MAQSGFIPSSGAGGHLNAWHPLGLVLRVNGVRAGSSAKQISDPTRRWDSSRLPVRSIIFLGAPHKGLETTALETLVKSQATEDIIRELKSESPTLTELNDKFRHVAKDIDILTCYELSPTKTAIEVRRCSVMRNIGFHLKRSDA